MQFEAAKRLAFNIQPSQNEGTIYSLGHLQLMAESMYWDCSRTLDISLTKQTLSLEILACSHGVVFKGCLIYNYQFLYFLDCCLKIILLTVFSCFHCGMGHLNFFLFNERWFLVYPFPSSWDGTNWVFWKPDVLHYLARTGS